MGLIIEDGHGSGRTAGVNSDGFLKAAGANATIEHHVNHHHGTAYTASFAQTSAAPGCIFYAKNNSDTDMCVEGFYLAVSGATNVYAQINNTVTSIAAGTGYTLVTPVNVNAGSGKTAEGTFAQGTALQTGSGLTAGGEVGRGVFAAAKDTTWYNFNQDLIIPKNKVITLWSSAAVLVTGMMDFNFHDDELG